MPQTIKIKPEDSLEIKFPDKEKDEYDLVVEIFNSFSWIEKDGLWLWKIFGSKTIIDMIKLSDGRPDILIYDRIKHGDDGRVTYGMSLSFESFLNSASKEVQEDLLFHLDIFIKYASN